MEIHQVKEMLGNFGVKPGCNPIDHTRFYKLIRTVQKWYGPYWGVCIMDLFMPCMAPIEPGYDGTQTHYQFCPMNWEEVEVEFAA